MTDAERSEYRLCEVVADLTHQFAFAPFVPGDSRETVRLTIAWAREFETKHVFVEWDGSEGKDYYLTVQQWFQNHYRAWLAGWHAEDVEGQDEILRGYGQPAAWAPDELPLSLRKRIEAWLAANPG